MDKNLEKAKKGLTLILEQVENPDHEEVEALVENLRLVQEYAQESLSHLLKVGKIPEKYNHINPDHYKNYSREVIDMMESIYGTDATAFYAEMNAFKYRMRMGTKPGQPIERDLEKEKWYLDKSRELREK